MMSELFDEQTLREQYYIAVKREFKEEGKTEGKAEGKAEGILETLVALVKKNILTIAQAAEQAKMTVPEFEDKSGLKRV